MAKVENKPIIREAMQLTCPITVHGPHGDIPAQVGDWLFKSPETQELYIVKAVVFNTAYSVKDTEK